MTGEPVARVDLRNAYRVYGDGGGYLVVSEIRRGQCYECGVLSDTAPYLCRELERHRVAAEQAGKAIEPVAERFRFPCTYSDKPRFLSLYLLVAAGASGEARIAKEGRSYVYWVSG